MERDFVSVAPIGKAVQYNIPEKFVAHELLKRDTNDARRILHYIYTPSVCVSHMFIRGENCISTARLIETYIFFFELS